MILRWFLSRAVRQACELRKHILKLLKAQQDLLSPQAIDAIQKPAEELRRALRTGAAREAILQRMKELDEAAMRWLKPFPHAGIRENVEVVLVAVTVALAIRTFFLQPMKIPTGSMQPTLFGITAENLKGKTGGEIPNGFGRFVDSWFRGISYYHIVAETDGELGQIEMPQTVLPFVKKQRFLVGDTWHTIWFPPATLPNRGIPSQYLIFAHADAPLGRHYQKGEDIIKLKVVAGDHLFVNRMTYNFRPPKRGEIVIFETRGIPGIQQQDTYYIKRLVALGGERVRIGNDQHLIINGERLDASTPHFENVYTFGKEPREYQYFGHVNGLAARRSNTGIDIPLFPDETAEFAVRPKHYLVMGDNTMNSADSRYWGDFPQEKVIGKSSFVYWPISSRFGWSHW